MISVEPFRRFSSATPRTQLWTRIEMIVSCASGANLDVEKKSTTSRTTPQQLSRTFSTFESSLELFFYFNVHSIDPIAAVDWPMNMHATTLLELCKGQV